MRNHPHIKELLAIATPQQYICFLFDLQLALMLHNEFLDYTEKGFEEHVTLMQGLKNFFEGLSEEN